MAWTVDINPISRPKLSFMVSRARKVDPCAFLNGDLVQPATFTRGAKQLVVQDAFDTTWRSLVYFACQVRE